MTTHRRIETYLMDMDGVLVHEQLSWAAVQAMSLATEVARGHANASVRRGVGAGRMGRPGGGLVARKCSAAASPPGTVGATAAWVSPGRRPHKP
jgi:hypothetical protein